MPRATDPARPDDSGSGDGIRHEIRRRGRLFGLEYDVDIRVTELVDPEVERSRLPPPGEPRRPTPPATP